MPALLKTDVTGVITWLGRVSERHRTPASDAQSALQAGFGGIKGEDHSGLTRLSCARVTTQYARGTKIVNVRQLSILSQEELDEIAQAMTLPVLDPALLGATMVISGIPDFSHLPPSSRIQGASGATIVVDMQNRPCHIPAKVIEAQHPNYGKTFKSAARHRRGVTAWVEREGTFSVGDPVTLHVPDQRAWRMIDPFLSGK